MHSRNVAYIPEIDHLRLLAALLVFFFHFFHFYTNDWRPWPHLALFGLITDGYTGVSLFFVLSGYIFMTIALAGGAIDYRSFLRNRLLRIAPLFLVVFVVAASIGRDRFRATDLLSVFVTNVGDPPTSWHFATGPAWSISVEFAFYLAFPFLAQFAKTQGVRYLARLIVILLVVKLAAYHAADNSRLMLYSTLVGRFDQFLIGMAAAMLAGAHRAFIVRRRWILMPLATLLVVAGGAAQARWVSFLAPEPKQAMGVAVGTIEAVLWGFFIVAYVGLRPAWPARVAALLRAGGEMSFSFYMWHALIIYAAFKTLGPLGGVSRPALIGDCALVLAFTAAFARLSYTTIEAPFLTLRRRYTAKALAPSRERARP
ncbi:acyltransferase [Alsobacter sp. KACC 23698]|uniref:Acyltransferase n=1 Tax=Alsobacter sp. KACC 23698 TaxID=3149229 RepID=A0AAU7JKB1_9HYPH